MGDKLAIVESPAKAKKIQGYLGTGWRVLASMGHVRDLPPKALGVDIAANFAPTYEISAGKSKVISQIKSAAKEAEAIYLATDPDREGEAIGWHVLETIKSAVKGKPVYRVTFGEITKKAIQAAFAQPRQLDMALVDSQQARRVLDRIVGWKVSPVLSHIFGTSLSAGRVQSVAVRLVVERELEIEAFVPEQYWTIEARFAKQPAPHAEFNARLTKLLAKADKEYDPVRLPTARAHNIATEVTQKGVTWRVVGIENKEQKQSAPPPFITSTLQQRAGSRLKLKPKQTMQIAQKLYEMGLITYMRTDSPAVSGEAQQKAREVIKNLFGEHYLPDKPNFYRAKGNAQEAHECIRPTDSAKIPKNTTLTGKDAELYRLIWMRFIASQMKAALWDVTIATIEPSNSGHALPYHFTARGRVLRDAGWLKVYSFTGEQDKDEDEADEENQKLPPLEVQEPVTLRHLAPKEHWTEPPPRYSEPTLIRALEKEGVGRPSTYASIMDTIQQRGYVETTQKTLTPTPAGREVTAFLTRQFPDLLDISFTRQMESDLDRVAEGQIKWYSLMGSFYPPLAARIDTARSQPGSDALLEKCPKCGGTIAEKYSRYGKFRICEGCGYKPDAPQPTDQACPDCGKPLIERKGKNGKFLGCTGYPDCTYTALSPNAKPKVTRKRSVKGKAATATVDTQMVGQPCPQCNKPLVERAGKYGPFLACSGYPACKYIHKNK
jgi:DNA topoisomerase-1